MSKEQEPAEDEEVYMLTPKGCIYGFLMDMVDEPDEAIEEIWDGLQAMCMRRIKITHPNAEYAALVFDGEGGDVIGISQQPEETPL